MVWCVWCGKENTLLNQMRNRSYMLPATRSGTFAQHTLLFCFLLFFVLKQKNALRGGIQLGKARHSSLYICTIHHVPFAAPRRRIAWRRLFTGNVACGCVLCVVCNHIKKLWREPNNKNSKLVGFLLRVVTGTSVHMSALYVCVRVCGFVDCTG